MKRRMKKLENAEILLEEEKEKEISKKIKIWIRGCRGNEIWVSENREGGTY